MTNRSESRKFKRKEIIWFCREERKTERVAAIFKYRRTMKKQNSSQPLETYKGVMD